MKRGPVKANKGSNNNKKQKISHEEETPKFIPLDWEDRPSEVKAKIVECWKIISKEKESKWGIYNGNETYRICHIDEVELLKTIIKSNPKEKEFYVLDVGAGNFQFGAHLEKKLNAAKDLPHDIKVYIFSLRGESNVGEEIVEKGIVKNINLGSFQIENLEEEFKKRSIELKGRAHMIVSSWCFRHLVDPLGTLLQVYSLLKPQMGYLLMDNFYYSRGDEGIKFPNRNMLSLLMDINDPFLVLKNASLDNFVLKRLNNEACKIPLTYQNLEKHPELDVASKQVTCFKEGGFLKKFKEFKASYAMQIAPYHCLSGNKDLYDFFERNFMFSVNDISYGNPIELDNQTPNEFQLSSIEQELSYTTPEPIIFSNFNNLEKDQNAILACPLNMELGLTLNSKKTVP